MVLTGLFQKGCHKNFISVIQYQYLHFMFAYGIKCTCGFTNVFSYLNNSIRLKLREMILAPFRKQDLFNNFWKDVKFNTEWVDSLRNTLQALTNIFHNGLIHTSFDNIWALQGMVIFMWK